MNEAEQIQMLKRDRFVLILFFILMFSMAVYAAYQWEKEREQSLFWMNKALIIDAR